MSLKVKGLPAVVRRGFSLPAKLTACSVLGLSILSGEANAEPTINVPRIVASENPGGIEKQYVDNMPDNDRIFLNSVDDVLAKVKAGKIKSAKLWVSEKNELNIPFYEFKLSNGNEQYLIKPDDEEDKRLKEGLLTLGSEPIYVKRGEKSFTEKFDIARLAPVILVVFIMAILTIAAKKQLGGSFFKKAKSNKKFDDIRGYPQLVKKLETIVDYMKNRDKYKIKCKVPKGILMTGKPGTGKTLLAKIIAGESGLPFYAVKGSDFVQMFAGVGATRMRNLFAKVKETGGIIFIDEIDAIAPKREFNQGASGKEYTQLLTELLTQMDGFDETTNVMVLAATNRPDILDDALVRSGRFDIHLNVYPPFTAKDRKDILDLYLGAHEERGELASDVDIDSLAENTIGFVGADLENLVNRAALLANEKGLSKITSEEFNSAITEIRLGIKHDTVVTDEDMFVSSVHEFSGHAFVGKILGRIIERISAEPWGQSLGHVRFSPRNHSELIPHYRELVEDLVGLMAGRAAEKHILPPGKHTIGAGGDYTQARNIIRRMITAGMFKGHNSNDYSNPLTELTEKDAELMDVVIDNALDVALKLVSRKPQGIHEAWVRSIIGKKEVVGERECDDCVAEILDDLDIGAIYREVVEPFVENPAKSNKQTD